MPQKRKTRLKKNDVNGTKPQFRGLPDKLNADCPGEFTADDGTLWIQDVQIRDEADRSPMSKIDFLWKWLFGFFIRSSDDSGPSPNIIEDEENAREIPRAQYTVKTRVQTSSWSAWLRLCMDVEETPFRPNSFYVKYLNWTFQTSFFTLFLSFLATFMLMIFLFGILLLIAGKWSPNCITVGGDAFDVSESQLADAFHLSWTTFTTVGYGVHATASGITEPDHKTCSLVTFLCTTESLIGLLYAGMCAAIFFGRVARVQSHAQVTFSEGICVEYGGAIKKSDVLIGAPSTGTSDEDLYQCPTLKFQLVNQLANSQNGEIMDATLKCVASNSIGNDASTRFVKVELKEFEHPFFKRVWHGRHVLNQNSLLLTPAARTKIIQNHGHWPAEWRSPEKVRACLNFKELIITLTGISNISASTVHAYKTYQFGDLLVGYEFAPLLYKTRGSSRLKVDLRLVNDVVVQRNLCNDFIKSTRSTDDDSETLRFSASKFTSIPFKTSSMISTPPSSSINSTIPRVRSLENLSSRSFNLAE